MTPEEVRAHLERVAAARENVRAAGGTWPAKRELAAALRGLLAEISVTAASESELRALAAQVRELTRAFQAAGYAQPGHWALPSGAGPRIPDEAGARLA